MKKFKPLLPCGSGRTMVQVCIDLFADAGVEQVVVVTGHHRERLESAVMQYGGWPVFNPGFESGMLSSIQQGVRHLNPDTKGFFLLPVDIPAIRPSTIKKLLKAFRKAPKKIAMPCFNEETGHPPLIPSALGQEILSIPPDGTMRDVMLTSCERINAVEVHDQGILMDADDPDGFKRIQKKMTELCIPNKEECLSILDQELPEEKNIRSHMAAVCMTAVKIAHAVQEDINIDLIIASALLHDAKRKEKRHADKGARMAREMGFAKVADIIAEHMDISVTTGSLKEKEIIFFADKLCQGDTLYLDYPKRFSQSMKRNPWAITSILKRYESTKQIHAKIENSAGRPVEQILQPEACALSSAPRSC